MKEIIVPGEHGLLVPLEQQTESPFGATRPEIFARDLATALNEFLNDESKARTMGKLGRDRVLAHFNWTAIAKETLALYEKVATDPRDRNRNFDFSRSLQPDGTHHNRATHTFPRPWPCPVLGLLPLPGINHPNKLQHSGFRSQIRLPYLDSKLLFNGHDRLHLAEIAGHELPSNFHRSTANEDSQDKG